MEDNWEMKETFTVSFYGTSLIQADSADEAKQILDEMLAEVASMYDITVEGF